MNQQPLPHSTEAEEATLGSLLIDPAAAPHVATFLRPEDFYIVKNGWVYKAILALGDKADLLTVAAELARHNLLEEAGGQSYLAQLTCAVPTALHVEVYARQVADAALRRRMIAAASQIAKDAYNNAIEASALPEQAQAAVMRAALAPHLSRAVTLPEALDQVLADVDAVLESGTIPGISTGISTLDRALGGLRPGRLTVIAGRPGAGKTTLMLQIAVAAARAGHPALVMSCEMTEAEMASVCVSHVAAMSLAPGDLAAMDARARSQARRRIADAMAQVAALPLILRCTPGISGPEFRLAVQAAQLAHGVRLAVADYIQLMTGDAKKGDNREQEVASVAGWLKRTAMELRIPIIAGAQVNDLGEVRESRRIEHDADALLVLERDSRESDALMVIVHIRKNRGGPTGDVALGYRRQTAYFGAIQP
ncbi:MAG: replicative DNA helicase [Aggregatilineales bacterium]